MRVHPRAGITIPLSNNKINKATRNGSNSMMKQYSRLITKEYNRIAMEASKKTHKSNHKNIKTHIFCFTRRKSKSNTKSHKNKNSHNRSLYKMSTNSNSFKKT